MEKYIKRAKVAIAALTIMSLVLSLNVSSVFAQNSNSITAGALVKAKGHPGIYYIGSDGKRYVFPNQQIFFSWYENFNNVTEVDENTVASFQLAGNVRYRPGILLVKIQSDPKVYAVSQNGILRWVKNEALAKKLYGDNWNLLIDDMPVTYFASYIIGDVINDASQYDPEDEEVSIATIDEDRLAKLKAKVQKKFEKRQERFCKHTEKQINRIQKRLQRRGVTIPGFGAGFLEQCIGQIGNGEDDDDEDEDDHNEKKITICHIPPGNPQNKQTLRVGKPAAKAHLAHGDTVGKCEGDSTADTTPPVISNKLATPQATTTLITWKTNESATSIVEYATSSMSTSTSVTQVSDSALVMSHSITLTNLTPSTLYYFLVKSRDAAGNTATSSEMTFTTLAASVPDTTPPVISSISATPLTTSATVTWTTNEAATGKVKYAKTSLASATTTNIVSNSSLITSHSLNLTSLESGTQYFYMVESSDGSGNTATSTERTFTTTVPVDATAPIISAVSATPLATSSTVIWTTNEAANSRVRYATQSLSTATTTFSVFNSSLVTSHSANLQNLTTSTQYFYKVESADASNNTATSTEQTFTTTS